MIILFNLNIFLSALSNVGVEYRLGVVPSTMRVPNPQALSDDRRSQSSNRNPTIGHRKPAVAAAAPPTTPKRRGAASRSPSPARGKRTPPTPTPSSGKSWIKSLFRAIRCRPGDPEAGAYPATKPSPSARVLRSRARKLSISPSIGIGLLVSARSL